MAVVEEWMYSNTFLVDLEESFSRWRLLEASLPVRRLPPIYPPTNPPYILSDCICTIMTTSNNTWGFLSFSTLVLINSFCIVRD